MAKTNPVESSEVIIKKSLYFSSIPGSNRVGTKIQL